MLKLLSYFFGGTDNTVDYQIDNNPPKYVAAKNNCRIVSNPSNGTITAMSMWNNMVVTGNDNGNLTLWTLNGDFIDTIDTGHSDSITALTTWDDLLVCGYDNQAIRFWKMEHSIDDIKCVVDFAAHDGAVMCCIVVDNRLYSTGRDGSIKIWNKKGGFIHAEDVNYNGVPKMVSYQGELWAVCYPDQMVRMKRDRFGLEMKNLSQLHIRATVIELCVWGDRIVFACADKSLNVWNMEHNVQLFQYHIKTHPVYLTEWNQWLVCAGSDGNSKTTLYFWNWDGSFFQRIQTDGDPTLLVVGNYLWQQHGKDIKIWKEPWEWKFERVLWIGWRNSECILSTMPKEILRLVISFL